MQNERQVSSYYETNNMNRMEREEMGEQIYRQDQVVEVTHKRSNNFFV
jgi:hypothetical protein